MDQTLADGESGMVDAPRMVRNELCARDYA